MPEQPVPMRFQLNRHALRDLDVRDDDAVHAWLEERASSFVLLHGRIEPAFLYMLDGTAEVVRLEGVFEIGQETIATAAFRTLGQREGVLRRFRECEVRLRDDAGTMRRAACVVELVAPEGDTAERWWITWRYFGQGEAQVGTFHGPWRRSSGASLDLLDDALRELIDPGEATADLGGFEEFGRRIPEDFDIRMAMLAPLPTAPAHPGALAVLIGRSMDAEILDRGLDHGIVFVATANSLERWEIRGELPCDIDDLIRNLAALGEPMGVALVLPGVASMSDGQNRRAVHTIAELPGHALRVRRVLPIQFEASGKPAPLPEVLQQMALQEGSGWIGVAPRVDLGIHALGMVGLPNTIAEG